MAFGRLATGGIVALLLAATPAFAQLPVPIPGGGTPDPAAPSTPRDTEPIVMKGAVFAGWAAPANQTVKVPLTDFETCPNPVDRSDPGCAHNHYEPPEVDTGDPTKAGTPVNRLLGFRWDDKANRFVQIPFQVDEVFERYLDNSASGFSGYSGEDKHTTYAYDREGWRYVDSDPKDVCKAIPFKVGNERPKTTPDPVPGLDGNDELAFMATDAGPQAPTGTPLPGGIQDAKEVLINDPNDPSADPGYVYVMRAAASGPKPKYDADNGYVSYKRDKVSETFEKSESSYEDYGNAGTGQYCDAEGNVVIDPTTGKPDIQRRRPRDYASIKTPRFKFRYDGRWLMTRLNIRTADGKTYGPDLIDRWKARAFAQDPSSNTPCCGFEEEDTHWGGSSTLLGERVGPVRALRETWGADSGTNVIRRETFYRDSVVQKSWLRVHPIPPLDGIYAQWDFNGGVVTKYSNRAHPDGVPVDGHNDEAFGNLDDPCNENYTPTDQIAAGYRSFYTSAMLCDLSPYHQSVDVFDPSFSQANAALEWSETSGPHGTVIDRYTTKPDDITAGGLAQSTVAVPYYRDDSCFDDGTGDDPGPRVKPGDENEPRKTSTGADRKCWHPEDGAPDGSDRFFQGDIATHGVHLLFIADSDNARQTVPIDEIVSEQQMVMLPGDAPKVTAPPPSDGSGGPIGSGAPAPQAAGPAYSDAWDQPLQPSAGPATTVRDASAPTVRLKLKRRGGRFSLRWSGADLGGSGLQSFTLQIKRPHGRFHTVLKNTHSRSLSFRGRRVGRWAFRVRAVDGAGNVSRWAQKRSVLHRRR